MLRVFLVATLALSLSCKGQKSKPPDITETPKDVVAGAPIDAVVAAVDLYGDSLPEGAIARLGSLRMVDRHIRRMIFSAEGNQVISTHKDGYQIWNLTDVSRGGLLEQEAAGELMSVSPDGKYLATSNESNTSIQLWDLSTGAPGARFTSPTAMVGFCFVDDTHVAALAEGSITTYQLGTTESSKVTGDWSKPTAFACSPGANWFAIGTKDGDAFVMKMGADKATRLGTAEKAIRAIAISHKGSTFAFGSDDEVIRIWSNDRPGPALEMQAHTRQVTSLAFTADDRKLYSTGGDAQFRVWDSETTELLEEMTGIEGLDAQLMAMSPDGNLMVSWSQYANARGSEGGRWWLWNAATGAPLLEPQRHSRAVTSVAYSPDGKHLVTSGEDRSLRVWDRDSSKGIAVIETAAGSINDAHFGSDGRYIYSAGADALLSKWDWQSDRETQVFEGIGGAVNRLVMSKDGTRAITGDQIGRVWSWDLESGNKIQAHDRMGYSAIYDLDLSSDDKMLAIVGSDLLVRVVDFQTGQEITSINPGDTTSNFAVRFSPDGKTLATAGDSHHIDVWSTSDWKRTLRMKGHDGTVRTIEYSPDGRHLISGGNDDTLKIWDTTSGAELASYKGHEGVITDLAVSPDGKTIASASLDRTVLFWPMPQ